MYLLQNFHGGQQQKVAIARALITNSNIILADEPTGNLDSDSSDEIIKLLQVQNKKNGATVVIVTHNAEIAALCDRVITLKDGTIIKDIRNKV